MEKLRLIYVSSSYSGAVVEGQVYELLEFYKNSGWFEDVLLLQAYDNEIDKGKATNILHKFSFRYLFFNDNPYYPHLMKKSIRSLSMLLKDEVKQNTVFHVRSGTRALYLKKALDRYGYNCFILTEFRGLLTNEMHYSKKQSFKQKLKTYIRLVHLNRCNRLMQKVNSITYTAVSPLLRDYVVQNEGFDFEKISVHPNLASEIFKYNNDSRIKVRKELGIRDDQILVVTSSGESGAWQKDIDVIDVLTEKGYVVLNLSKNVIEKPNVISRFLSHKEMPAYLSACDAALLWRDDVPLNNVACPSKFSEFAVMGLYVIHNKTVDIVSRYIFENNTGQLVSSPNQIKLDEELFSQKRRLQRCRAGSRVYSINAIAKSYFDIYGQGYQSLRQE